VTSLGPVSDARKRRGGGDAEEECVSQMLRNVNVVQFLILISFELLWESSHRMECDGTNVADRWHWRDE
jgi:hypothetical protein